MNQPMSNLKLTTQKKRVLMLLFKFRFVTSHLLATYLNIRRSSTYEVLEYLTKHDLVTKIYAPEYRINRRPAYYYLSKDGVTLVRKIMDVEESVVHSLYKNGNASEDFIRLSLLTLNHYTTIRNHLPEGSEIFTRSEINRLKEFPKNKPDLYVRTSDGNEAIFIIADTKPSYIIKKRLEEIIAHNDSGDWDGEYPAIIFIFNDGNSMHRFLYFAHKVLESTGIDDELTILGTYNKALDDDIWYSALSPSKPKNGLF